jgi:serine O-acetyltransferase
VVVDEITTFQLDDVVEKMLESYEQVGSIHHIGGPHLPSRDRTIEIWCTLRSILFPGYFEREPLDDASLRDLTRERMAWVRRNLSGQIHKSLCHECELYDQCDRMGECADKARAVADALLQELPDIRSRLHLDALAALEGDPAAKSLSEVILSYPGMTAIAVHRISNFLYRSDVPLVPRIMSEYIHHQTGIDIHPGATIGDSFFIDHGTGVVIGETTVIGNDVKIYQGVTLGALSVKKSLARNQRHPTIEDGVTIYAGATILGGEAVIGEHSIIGGNVWLIHSVPAYSRVYNSAVSSHPIVESSNNGANIYHI